MGATLGILFGLLMIVAGITLILVCGFDPLFSLAGLILIGAGSVLAWRLRATPGTAVEETVAPGQRAVQTPINKAASSKSGMNRRI